MTTCRGFSRLFRWASAGAAALALGAFSAGEAPLAGHDELYKARALAAFEIDPRLTPFFGAGVAVSVRGAAEIAASVAPEICAGIVL
jgi:hypothetical protein